MKKFLHTTEIFLLLVLTFFTYRAESQDLINSRKNSPYAFLYKISTAEAQKIHTGSLWCADTTFFHTPVDSFPTDSVYNRTLPEGHYIKVFAADNNLKMEITSVQNFDVFILNNYTDLCVMVTDMQGHVIKDALVKVRSEKLKYNPEAQCYIHKKSNKKGLLSVTYNGFTAFYDLSREYNNPAWKRAAWRVGYRSPLKYVWLPVNFVLRLPLDGVRSLRYGWPVGSIYWISRLGMNFYNRLACVFEPYYCDYLSENFEMKHLKYFAFNKAKYMPGDTVKFKTYIVNRKGRPINETVDVYLETYDKSYFLGKLEPYRKGAYTYSFVLHDSLNLNIDRMYHIRLSKNKRKLYTENYFSIADYELKKNKLDIRSDTNIHYKGTPFKFYARATDDNELNLMDARLEMYITPRIAADIFNKNVFIPDKLFLPVKKLLPYGETEIIIPDSIMPEANFNYEIFFRLLTSDNEALNTSKKISYFHEKARFDVQITGDSIAFVYKKNDKECRTEAQIFVMDNFGNNKTEIYKGALPCKLRINPFYASYSVSNGAITETIQLSKFPSRLECFSERKNDSVLIVVNNPHKIKFSYSIYKRDKLLEQGYSDTLNYALKTASKETFCFSIRYIWGGRVVENIYSIPLYTQLLNVKATHLSVVYPGQKTKIEVTVTDYKGRPVKNADVTAYSMTRKFAYTPPDIPVFGNNKKEKSIINIFEIDKQRTASLSKQLNYNFWKDKFGLDTIEYFKFLYPQNGLYTYAYFTSDSITQFAPFVVKNGEIENVHVVYLDRKPVYFSWSTNTQPYAFRAGSGYHQVKLRTATRTITIDSLYFEAGKKLIFSIDINRLSQNTSATEEKPELSTGEQQNLYRYILPYNNTFDEKYTYLEQDKNLILLNPAFNAYNHFAGPVSGQWNFISKKGFSTGFTHEPYFKYEFQPEKLILRCIDQNSYPKKLNQDNRSYLPLYDKVLTKARLEASWQDYLYQKRYTDKYYEITNYSYKSTGAVSFTLARNDSLPVKHPLNLIVYKHDDYNFLNIYNGITTRLNNLDSGYYRFLFVYKEGYYQVEDSLYIKTGGTNYFRFIQPDTLLKDAFGVKMDKLLNDCYLQPSKYYYFPGRDSTMRAILNLTQNEYIYQGNEGAFYGSIQGKITDAETKEPIPFANIVIESAGRQVGGASSDFDGRYRIAPLPPGRYDLKAASIGFKPIMVTGVIISPDMITFKNMTMEPTSEILSEFIVTEYAVPLISKDQTSSGGTMTYQEIVKMPGRSAESVAVTVGGVFSPDYDMGFVRGAREEGTVTFIDGIRVRGSSGIPQSAIDQVTIITGGIPSGYGDMSSKGMVSIIIPGAQTVYFEKTPLFIVNGNIYAGDISAINPAHIEKIEILKDSKATAPYGENGIHGVVVITTTPGTYGAGATWDKGAAYDAAFFEAAMKSGTIRNRFSDYAFWEPRLTTDENGKVSFEVVFPDDVTAWDVFFYAMTEQKQSGFAQSRIKSYKPLMAQLAAPRFLLPGDTAYAIGKVLNLSPGSVEVTTQFGINDSTLFERKAVCAHAITDTLPITATADSARVKYEFRTADGYFDGEQRSIEVFPLGIEEAVGRFYVLDNDTTLQITFDSTMGVVKLYAQAGMLDVVESEITHVQNYRYLCNEQIASKLKTLLARQTIAGFKGEKFKADKEVEKLIALLLKNKSENGFWGWWKDAPETGWISCHVMEALLLAETHGFKVQMPKIKFTQDLIWKIDNTRDFNLKAGWLKLLHRLAPDVKQELYIKDLEKSNQNLNLYEQLQLAELKQLNKLAYDTGLLKQFQKTTLFGSIYFSDTSSRLNPFENDMLNTITAYRILKRDTTTPAGTLQKIRNYFFECKKSAYWTNTYEASVIIETLLPDIINGQKAVSTPEITFTGALSKTVKDFPFEAEINAGKPLYVKKSGNVPVFFTAYQLQRKTNPPGKQKDFQIETSFSNGSETLLEAGKDVNLTVTVNMPCEADYVMISIPVPASCSYAEKKNRNHYETHRESYRNETLVFCEKLTKGKHVFEVSLVPRYTGSYTLNPAQIQLMYFPVFNANNETKRVVVK